MNQREQTILLAGFILGSTKEHNQPPPIWAVIAQLFATTDETPAPFIAEASLADPIDIPAAVEACPAPPAFHPDARMWYDHVPDAKGSCPSPGAVVEVELRNGRRLLPKAAGLLGWGKQEESEWEIVKYRYAEPVESQAYEPDPDITEELTGIVVSQISEKEEDKSHSASETEGKKRKPMSEEAKQRISAGRRAALERKRAEQGTQAAPEPEEPPAPLPAAPAKKEEHLASSEIAVNSDWIGKREPGQTLTDSDWPEIKAMMQKYGHSRVSIRKIAGDYDQPLEIMDAFVDRQLLNDARSKRNP